MCDSIVARKFSKLNDFEQTVLDAHNSARAKFDSTSRPLVWDERLAAYAASWNEKMCNSKSWRHSQGSYGENLAIGLSPSKGVEKWFDEYKALKNYVNDPEVYFNHAGHFTQVVWKNTTSLGCDIRSCPHPLDSQSLTANVPMLTCEYSPAGNVGGAFGENVPPNKLSRLLS